MRYLSVVCTVALLLACHPAPKVITVGGQDFTRAEYRERIERQLEVEGYIPTCLAQLPRIRMMALGEGTSGWHMREVYEEVCEQK